MNFPTESIELFALMLWLLLLVAAYLVVSYLHGLTKIGDRVLSELFRLNEQLQQTREMLDTHLPQIDEHLGGIGEDVSKIAEEVDER